MTKMRRSLLEIARTGDRRHLRINSCLSTPLLDQTRRGERSFRAERPDRHEARCSTNCGRMAQAVNSYLTRLWHDLAPRDACSDAGSPLHRLFFRNSTHPDRSKERASGRFPSARTGRSSGGRKSRRPILSNNTSSACSASRPPDLIGPPSVIDRMPPVTRLPHRERPHSGESVLSNGSC
jgi:hypothetical protein